MFDKKWNERYMEIADLIATWSKDPSTKVGAVAIGSKGQILAQGYNGFPRLIKDSEERLNNRQIKYSYTIHAESNLIYNALENRASLNSSVVYISGLPICVECTKSLIQVGVTFVCIKESDILKCTDIWRKNWELSKKMLLEARVGTIII